MHLGRFFVKARRFVAAAAFAISLFVAAPYAFAGNPTEPWEMPGPDNCSMLLNAALTGVEAALTVL